MFSRELFARLIWKDSICRTTQVSNDDNFSIDKFGKMRKIADIYYEAYETIQLLLVSIAGLVAAA